MSNEERIVFSIDVYSVESVKRAAYTFTGRASFDIRVEAGEIICIVSPLSQDVDLPADFTGRFRNAVLDQGLRERIAAETENLRNVILAQAFSKTGLQD